MVTGWHPCGSSGVLRLLPGPVPGGPVTGTLDGKVVLLSGTGRSMGRVAQRVSAEGAIVAGGDIDAAAAAETLKLIQKDGFSPGTAGPLDVTGEG